MVQEILLYKDREGTEIKAEVGDAYEYMLSEVESENNGDVKVQLCSAVENMIHQSIQSRPRTDSQLNRAYAELIEQMQETNDIDLDRLVENSIHAIKQQE